MSKAWLQGPALRRVALLSMLLFGLSGCYYHHYGFDDRGYGRHYGGGHSYRGDHRHHDYRRDSRRHQHDGHRRRGWRGDD